MGNPIKQDMACSPETDDQCGDKKGQFYTKYRQVFYHEVAPFVVAMPLQM